MGVIFLFGIFAGTVITIIYLLKQKEETETPLEILPVAQVSQEVPISSLIPMEAPVGFAYNKVVSVTDGLTELYHQVDNFPWSSFSLYNAGPNSVYCCVNDWEGAEAPILVGQSVDYDFKRRGSIKKVLLKCDTGNTTSVNLNVIV